MADNPVPSPAAGKRLGDVLFTGTLWMFAMRWIMRLMSVVSVVVLARLLDREDFGLAALAAAMTALPLVLLELGMEQAVIREPNPDRGFYNTAWTLRLLQMTAIAVLVYAGAPLAAMLYEDPRLGDIMEVLALWVVLRGAENFWTVSFRKQLNFRRDFAYETICKLLGVAITIGLAIWLRSYWALIYGQVAGGVLRVLLSLTMAPHWPRPTLSHWRRIWSFSQWSLVRGFANYIVQKSDTLILGRLAPIEVVGAYTMAREIAELPVSEISAPANRSLGPGFARLQDNRPRLAAALASSLGAVASVTFPIALGLALTAPELVHVMLGARWLPSAPFLVLLSLAGLLLPIRAVMGNTLVVIGHIRLSALVMWVRALSFLALALPMTAHGGGLGCAAAFAAAEVLTSVVTFGLYRRRLPELTPGMLVARIARPALSAAAMAAAVLAVRHGGIAEPLPLLACMVAAGAVSYAAALGGLWLLAGQPDGIERMVLDRLSSLRQAA